MSQAGIYGERAIAMISSLKVLPTPQNYSIFFAVAAGQASGLIKEVDQHIALGELALDGALLPVNGVLPAAMQALTQEKGLICPQVSGGEAAWSGLESILAPSSLPA